MIPNWKMDESGWTLVEMVLTLALVGLLAALAFPAFAQLGERVERQLFLNQLLAEIRMAQREAVSRERQVAFEVDRTGRAYRITRGGKVLQEKRVPNRYHLKSNYPGNRLHFHPSGQVRGGRFQLYKGEKQVGEVIVQVASGRARVEVEW